jgi:hypothetical protein
MEWPEPDPSLHQYAAAWFEVVGQVHPHPTLAAAQVARQWAEAFSARIAAGMDIPIPMVFEGEEAVGVRDEMCRDSNTALAHLVYWRVAAESGTSPR